MGTTSSWARAERDEVHSEIRESGRVESRCDPLE
jgi:hypothetical protein